MSNTVENLRFLYCNIMAEIKSRSEVIAHIFEEKTRLGAGTRCELCYLQLRMIYELIALGCLAAHGNIQATHTGKLRSMKPTKS